MTITKLSLYNDALRIVGAERLASLTEGREARFKLDEIYDLGAVDYCLKLGQPDFSRRVVLLDNPTTVTNHALNQKYALPADFLSLLIDNEGNQAVFRDANLDQPISRFLREGAFLSCNESVVYIRYIANIDEVTEWSPEFVRMFTAYLAKELANRIAPHKYADAMAMFDSMTENVRGIAASQDRYMRPKKTDVSVTQEWLPIYNDAAMILGTMHLRGLNEDSQFRVLMDVARQSLAVEGLLEETGWNWAITSRKSVQNSRLEPQWGYQYVHEKPLDMLRLDGLYRDEHMTYPLKEYQDEDLNIHCNLQDIYIKYVSTDYLYNLSKWPAHFRRFVASRLAYDVRHNPYFQLDAQRRAEVQSEYMDRKRNSKNVDAMQSPPIIIRKGSWLRARLQGSDYEGRPSGNY